MAMHRIRLAVALAVLLVACRPVTERAPVESPPARSRVATRSASNAGKRWAATEENVAVALPPDLFYCPLSDDRNGVDRAQTFLLSPRPPCEPSGESAIDSSAPSINVYAVSNIIALEDLGGIGEANSAVDLARAACAAPELFTDVIIFSRPAVGCTAERGDVLSVTLFGISDSAARGATKPPSRATVTLRLHTMRSRLSRDWAVLRAMAAGVYVCDPVAASHGRVVACPPGGPW